MPPESVATVGIKYDDVSIVPRCLRFVRELWRVWRAAPDMNPSARVYAAWTLAGATFKGRRL